MKHLLELSLLAALVSGGAAPARAGATGGPGDGDEYRIGAQDVLQVAVFGNEELSRIVTVRPDGMISLPLLNDVQAEGLTPMELRTVLLERLVEFVPSPEIAVIVTEVRSLMISVIGQVMKPGRYDLRAAATVVDALALAGGLKEFASRSKIVVIRSEGATKRKVPFNYDKLDSTKSPQENFLLRPDDIVLVP
jgi:polysaccharide export outer membrane protein